MSTRELIAILSGLGALIALAYVLGVEPKTKESFLLVIPAILVSFVVDYVLSRNEDSA